MDLKGTGVTTIDEWPKLGVEYIIANAATLAAHPRCLLQAATADDGCQRIFLQTHYHGCLYPQDVWICSHYYGAVQD